MYRRFTFFLVLVFAAVTGAYVFYVKEQRAVVEEAFAASRKEELVRLKAMLEGSAKRLQSFVTEYSLTEPFEDFATGRVAERWVDNSRALAPLYEADCVWLFDMSMRARSSFLAPGRTVELEPFFLSELRDAQLGSLFGHFYTLDKGILWEIAYAPVQPASDIRRGSAPRGFVVALRKWDGVTIARASDSMGVSIRVFTGNMALSLSGAESISPSAITARLPISSRLGDTIAYVVETRSLAIIDKMQAQLELRTYAALGCLGGLFLLSALVGYLSLGRPIRKLKRYLRVGDPDIIGGAKGDFGILAEAVQLAYAQQSNRQSENMTKSSGDKLIHRDRFFGTILRYINGIVLVVSHDGVLTLAEGRDLDAYGMSKERDEGRPISSILRGQDRLSQFEAALRGKRSSMEQKVGERIFLTMCEPLPGQDGGTDSIVVLALDMTEKRQVEENLLKAKQEAERADKVKTQFLSVMSHETRTPLNGVLGFASVLRETPLNEEQIGYLDRIVESGQNLLRLLTDILDLARLEAGEGRKNPEPISLTALVYQFAERYRIACQQKGHIEFDLDMDQRMPDFIESDNEMLSRILSSLLDNAVKFTDAGKVRFSVSWLSKDKDGKSGVMFKVSDTGPGIEPELARNLFNPFSQGDSSRTRRHGGLGLGLTIAHRLATQLEGRLSFETKLDIGTTFSFFLPTRAMDESAARKAVRE